MACYMQISLERKSCHLQPWRRRQRLDYPTTVFEYQPETRRARDAPPNRPLSWRKLFPVQAAPVAATERRACSQLSHRPTEQMKSVLRGVEDSTEL